MRNEFTEAVCSTQTGNVNMNLFVAGKCEAVEFCSIKTAINSPPSTCSHGSTVHVSLVCSSSLFFFPFWTFPSLRGCNLCADLHMRLYTAPRELEIWQLFTVLGLWLTDAIFTVWPFGLCSWSETRDWKNPSQRPGRVSSYSVDVLLNGTLQLPDILRAFLFLYYMYPMIQQDQGGGGDY